MKRLSEKAPEIQIHLNTLLVPAEVLADFIITKIEEKVDILLIELTEKEERVSLLNAGIELVLNGYLNALEIQSFPVMGKPCILRLNRRRWKAKGQPSGNYYNDYSYTADGVKVTPKFGAFLKSIGR